MKALLHLREGVTPAGFGTLLARQIRAGEHKAWELVRSRPLTIRHKGRFKSVVTLTPPSQRIVREWPRADLVAKMTGADAGFVLRYFVGLVVLKLGESVESCHLPIDEP